MLVVLAILLVFGPGKIPEIARNLGKFINDIKRATEDIKTEINTEGERLDREKRLAEYKASQNEEIENSLESHEKDSQDVEHENSMEPYKKNSQNEETENSLAPHEKDSQ